jgi:hypothetical protein
VAGGDKQVGVSRSVLLQVTLALQKVTLAPMQKVTLAPNGTGLLTP